MTNLDASGHKYAFKVKKNFWIGTPFCKIKKIWVLNCLQHLHLTKSWKVYKNKLLKGNKRG